MEEEKHSSSMLGRYRDAFEHGGRKTFFFLHGLTMSRNFETLAS